MAVGHFRLNALHGLALVGGLVLAVVLAGCAQPGQRVKATEPVTIQQQWQGQDAGLTQPGLYLIVSRGQLVELGCQSLVEEVLERGIDFGRQQLVLVALGEQNTGGHWVQITALQSDGQRIYVQGLANRPGPDDMTTQVITYPFAVAVIARGPASMIRSEIKSVVGQMAPE